MAIPLGVVWTQVYLVNTTFHNCQTWALKKRVPFTESMHFRMPNRQITSSQIKLAIVATLTHCECYCLNPLGVTFRCSLDAYMASRRSVDEIDESEGGGIGFRGGLVIA